MSTLWDASNFERAIDLLCDQRLPHALPRSLWRLWKYKEIPRSIRLPGPLHVCLTFDVERDFRQATSTDSTERFLPKYYRWAEDQGVKSTLYIQGDLLPQLRNRFEPFLGNHEFGLHGLHHEVWGRSRWGQFSLGYRSISVEEKRANLMEALTRFDKSGLPRPVSFRAPYLNADTATLDLLEEFDFTSDSSVATYYGPLCVPYKRGNLWRIPVAVDPRPAIQMRGLHSLYTELSMDTISNVSDEKLCDLVTACLYLQSIEGWNLPPFIVILGHPWEFELTPGVRHSSEANFDTLANKLKSLQEHFSVTFSTVSELIDCGRGMRPASKGDEIA